MSPCDVILVLQVSVHLERIGTPWEFEVKSFKFVKEMEPPEQKRRRERDADSDGSRGDQYSEDDGLDFVDNELEDARRLQIARLNAPIVHVKKFPFRIREKWLVMLIDVTQNIVIDQRAVPDLSGLRKVDLHLRPQKPKTGKYPYRVIVKCDSYLGADKMVPFELMINCDPAGRKKGKRSGKSSKSSSEEASTDSINYNIPTDPSDDVDPKLSTCCHVVSVGVSFWLKC